MFYMYLWVRISRKTLQQWKGEGLQGLVDDGRGLGFKYHGLEQPKMRKEQNMAIKSCCGRMRDPLTQNCTRATGTTNQTAAKKSSNH